MRRLLFLLLLALFLLGLGRLLAGYLRLAVAGGGGRILRLSPALLLLEDTGNHGGLSFLNRQHPVKKDSSVIYVHRAQVWKIVAEIDTEQKVTVQIQICHLLTDVNRQGMIYSRDGSGFSKYSGSDPKD